MSSLKKVGLGGLNVTTVPSLNNALDLHTAPAVDDSLLKGKSVYYNPTNQISDNGEIEFNIPPDPECFQILNQTRLEGYFVVQDENGNNVGNTDVVSMEHDYVSCLFSQIEVYVNGTQVCDLSSSLNYPFKHYLDATLSYSYHVLSNRGQTEGYRIIGRRNCSFNYKTVNGEKVLDNANSCGCYRERWYLLKEGGQLYFSTALPVDLFYTDKYLPPDITMQIKLKRSPPGFGIINISNEKKFTMKLKECTLKMRKVLPTQRVRDRFNAKLLRQPCFLPYKDSQLKMFNVNEGLMSYHTPIINDHHMPSMIVFGMIKANSLTDPIRGINIGPFSFRNMNYSSVMLKKDGKPLLPRAIELDKSTNDHYIVHRMMQDDIGTLNSVSLTHFEKDSFLFVMDLTPDKCKSYHHHPSTAGKLDLELNFSQPLDENKILVCYTIYNGGIAMDKNLQIRKITY